MIWSTVLAAVGIFGLYVSSKGKAWGFLVGMAAQPLWLAYALATEQYGFMPMSLAYGYVYARNFLRWRSAS